MDVTKDDVAGARSKRLKRSRLEERAERFTAERNRLDLEIEAMNRELLELEEDYEQAISNNARPYKLPSGAWGVILPPGHKHGHPGDQVFVVARSCEMTKTLREMQDSADWGETWSVV